MLTTARNNMAIFDGGVDATNISDQDSLPQNWLGNIQVTLMIAGYLILFGRRRDMSLLPPFIPHLPSRTGRIPL
jgi:hypothetical protein